MPRPLWPGGSGSGDALTRRCVSLRLTDAHASVRDLLRSQGADRKVDGTNRLESVADLIDDLLADTGRTGGTAPHLT